MIPALRGGADDSRVDGVRVDGVRVDWIDTAKGISILLVTLHHVALLGAAADLPVYKMVTLSSFLAPVRMPLFFATAGVFAGSIIAKRWPELLTRRVALYVWLFLVWTVIRWCFSAFVVQNPASPTEGSHVSEIGWAMLMPTTGLWFLWSLALFFILAKLLSAAPRRASIAVAVFASIFVMIALANREHRGVPDVLDNIAHRNSILYFVFFYVAAVAPHLIQALGRVRIWRSIAISAGVFAAATLVIRLADIDIIVGIAGFIASLAGVSALLLSARLLDRLSPVAKTMHYIGRNTLPIYVAQVPLIALFTTWIAWAGGAALGPIANLLIVVQVFVVAAAALLLRAILLKFGADWLYELPAQKFHLPRKTLAG